MEEMEVDFTKPWTHSDVIFKIEDQQIHASKAVLALASPVFSKIFSSEFKEKNATEIPLPGKKIDSFVELMKVVHYRHKTITKANVYTLLPLTHEYQMKHLTECCENILQSLDTKDTVNTNCYMGKDHAVIKHLVLADTYDLPNLRKHCIKLSGNIKLRSLENDTQYPNVQPATLIKVLKSIIRTLEKL